MVLLLDIHCVETVRRRWSDPLVAGIWIPRTNNNTINPFFYFNTLTSWTASRNGFV